MGTSIYMTKYVICLFSGVILRPGFIYGTRSVGSMKIPLGVIGSPLEMVNSLCIIYNIFFVFSYVPHLCWNHDVKMPDSYEYLVQPDLAKEGTFLLQSHCFPPEIP